MTEKLKYKENVKIHNNKQPMAGPYLCKTKNRNDCKGRQMKPTHKYLWTFMFSGFQQMEKVKYCMHLLYIKYCMHLLYIVYGPHLETEKFAQISWLKLSQIE